MASRRTLKAAQAIREVVALSLLSGVKDPRVEGVTITSVEVAGDMRSAKVFFTVLGSDPAKEKLALKGLQSCAGFLQQRCAKRIETRYTPRLAFEVDEGVKNLARVSEILQQERLAREASAAESGGQARDLAEDPPEAPAAEQGQDEPFAR